MLQEQTTLLAARWRRLPAVAFTIASLIFGAVISFVTPPLRGHDETAHFLRAYGVATGDFIASLKDTQGRKGVLLPPALHAGFIFFEDVRVREKTAAWRGYAPEFADYGRSPRIVSTIAATPQFVPYAGSEGYSPLAYLPQSAAALLARAVDADFLTTLYLMRLASVVAFTALIAWAITLVPPLGWAFAAVAMLPSALYGRAIVSADASALATAVLVTALWLHSLLDRTNATRAFGLWLTLSVLSKPVNIAFVIPGLLGAFARSRRRIGASLAAAVPALAAAVAWSVMSGADTANWRLVEITGLDPIAFDPGRKLMYLVEDPLQFPAAVIGALGEHDYGELWRQTIGVLGLFDTVLQSWVYPTLTVLLLVVCAARLPLGSQRQSVAIATGATVVAYTVLLYFICYVSFTPLGATTVWGVQGRYFVPVLPLLAIGGSALLNLATPNLPAAVAAIVLMLLSGIASIDAILRSDWHV